MRLSKTQLRCKKFFANFNYKRAKRKKTISICLFFWFCLVALIVSGLWPIGLATFSVEKMGSFGDSYGALNTLFSGLAFAGIIASLWMQKDELRLQREELKSQRIEMARQADELLGQKEEIERQRKLAERNEFERFYIFLYNKLESINNVSDLQSLLNFTAKAEWNKKNISPSDLKNPNKFNTDRISHNISSSNDNKKLFEFFKLLYSHIMESDVEINKQQYIDALISSLNDDKKNLLYICYLLLTQNNPDDIKGINECKHHIISFLSHLHS